MIIDSHCHIDFSEFDKDREQVLNRAANAGVDKIVVPGVMKKTWQRIQDYCNTYTQLYPCFGLHPYFIEQHSEQDLVHLKKLLQTNRPVAIGECGLDFYIKNPDKGLQQLYFEQQLQLSIEFDLPVVIHARKSTEAVIQSLKKLPRVRGMIHSYSGSLEQAKQLIDLGFYLSFGGPITFEGASRLHNIVKSLPLTSILLETDAPDQPGANATSNRNEPAFIIDVLNMVARLQSVDSDLVATTTSENATTLFQLV